MADEDIDLDDERRRYVDAMFARLAGLTHYEALALAPTADRKEIKRAYFHLVGIVHPDRYFGKKLGPYKPKLEAVFARVTLAYETLYDRDKRKVYDAQLPGGGAPPSPLPAVGAPAPAPAAAPRAAAPVDPVTAAKRKEAMAALQARFADAPARAKARADAATRALAAGDLAAAVAAYEQALVFAPNDGPLRKAYEEARRAMTEKVTSSHAAKAAIAEKLGQWPQAVEAWRRVLEARPDDASVRARLETALARAGTARR